MSHARSLSTLMAIAALGFAAPLLAQDRTAVSGAELDAAAANHVSPRAASARALLSSAQAQAVAGRMGVTAPELAVRVNGLDAAALDQLAQQAGVTDQDLAGGSNTVVISTTTIIIVLLILILVSS